MEYSKYKLLCATITFLIIVTSMLIYTVPDEDSKLRDLYRANKEAGNLVQIRNRCIEDLVQLEREYDDTVVTAQIIHTEISNLYDMMNMQKNTIEKLEEENRHLTNIINPIKENLDGIIADIKVADGRLISKMDEIGLQYEKMAKIADVTNASDAVAQTRGTEKDTYTHQMNEKDLVDAMTEYKKLIKMYSQFLEAKQALEELHTIYHKNYLSRSSLLHFNEGQVDIAKTLVYEYENKYMMLNAGMDDVRDRLLVLDQSMKEHLDYCDRLNAYIETFRSDRKLYNLIKRASVAV